ncbi:MAG: DUF547 domain-containing protein [Myxococcota bacterium]|nr:DUF547 domain-containing protein [Myxococcota bacterium]
MTHWVEEPPRRFLPGRRADSEIWRERANRFAKFVVSLVLLVLTGAGGTASASEGKGPGREASDWLDLYTQILSRHTRAVDAEVGTEVDYAAIKEDPDWRLLISQLASQPSSGPSEPSAKLAFWINVYNLFAIDSVVTHYPVASIKDIGSFFRPVWKRVAGHVGERAYSLDEIEHEILRPMGDPRIHGAIVCASISCPNLRREPYRAETVSEQLDQNVASWLARPEKGLSIDRSARIVRLSRIFDWFEDDFGGRPGVLKFVGRFASAEQRRWLEENRADFKVEFLRYDWRLNDVPPRTPSTE